MYCRARMDCKWKCICENARESPSELKYSTIRSSQFLRCFLQQPDEHAVLQKVDPADNRLPGKLHVSGTTPLTAGLYVLPSFGRVMVVTKPAQMPPGRELGRYLRRQLAAAKANASPAADANALPASEAKASPAAGPAGGGAGVSLREAWRAYVLAQQPYPAVGEEMELLKVKSYSG